MAKKFEVAFATPNPFSGSMVYISPSEGYPGKFSVGILHPVKHSGTFQSTSGLAKTFDLKQNLVDSEEEATTWATNWLSIESATTASLIEVAAE